MLNKVKANIDTKIVASVVVASFVTGLIIIGLNKAGMRHVAAIAKGGN